MAIRCRRLDCYFNGGGWCDLFSIEIDENGRCVDYKKRGEDK